jgi:hypothetical protein
VFGTVSALAGLAPIRSAEVTRGGAYGGLRIEGGLQGSRHALALALRYWELVPTSTLGGSGLELLLHGERRIGASTRTAFRAGLGVGFEQVNSGRSGVGPSSSADGYTLSVGVGHEVALPNGELLLLSGDVIAPNPGGNSDGRRPAVLELGVGYRLRQYRAIELPQPPRARR